MTRNRPWGLPWPEFEPLPDDMTWRPIEPERYVHIQRNGETWYVFAIVDKIDQGENVRVVCESPLRVLDNYPLPYRPPGTEGRDVDIVDAFAHHWRQLHYTFQIPEPRLMAPLKVSLPAAQEVLVRRFIEVAGDLADDALVCGQKDTWISIDTTTDTPTYSLPKRVAQAGFAVVLRQCENPPEPASFRPVRNLLSAAYAAEGNRPAVEVLRAWKRYEARMLNKSLGELVFATLVDRDGWHPQSHRLVVAPSVLLDRYRYSDLIHFDDTAADDRPEVITASERLDYLDASVSLAHLYIGFADLATAALGD